MNLIATDGKKQLRHELRENGIVIVFAQFAYFVAKFFEFDAIAVTGNHFSLIQHTP
jgi:hypothetical protein